MKKKVIFVSSTGGHLKELLQLEPLILKNNSILITEKTKSNIHYKGDSRFEKVFLLPYATKSEPLKYIFVFPYNILKSFILFLNIRPDYIISTGAHTAVPMCYFAKLFGKKIIYIETYANMKSKSMAGTLVYPIADLFLVQWESMLELYPNAKYYGGIF